MSRPNGTAKPSLGEKARVWASALKNDVMTLYYVLKHPGTPLHVRLLVGIIVGYALSPIDLIPDFIPVLGYLDDVLILPLGIMLVLKLVPRDVLTACRETARTSGLPFRPRAWISACVVVGIWIAVIYWVYRRLR